MLVPFIYLVWVVGRYSVEVPFADQWELVPILEKSYQGELTFGDLWAQHNEHRIFFPRLIMLGLARMTHWRIGWELALTIILATGLLGLLAWQIKRTARALGAEELRWALPAGSLVVFSMSQYQNWLWGWQLQILLSLLAVTGGIVLLANAPFTWRKFVGAAVLGFVASHSFANGILFWPVGLVLLMRSRPSAETAAGRWRFRTAPVFLWVLLAALTLASYLLGYQEPGRHPARDTALTHPLSYLMYNLKFLGSPCAQYGNAAVLPDSTIAVVFGLGALALLAWATRALVWGNRAAETALRPYLAMSFYSILSALLTGIGRAAFGSEQAMESRYCTLTVPLWISLVVFLILLARTGASGGNVPRLARWALGVVLVFIALSSALGVKQAQGILEARSEGKTYLLQLGAHPEAKPDIDELFRVYPTRNPGAIVERVGVLSRERLSLFRDER